MKWNHVILVLVAVLSVVSCAKKEKYTEEQVLQQEEQVTLASSVFYTGEAVPGYTRATISGESGTINQPGQGGTGGDAGSIPAPGSGSDSSGDSSGSTGGGSTDGSSGGSTGDSDGSSGSSGGDSSSGDSASSGGSAGDSSDGSSGSGGTASGDGGTIPGGNSGGDGSDTGSVPGDQAGGSSDGSSGGSSSGGDTGGSESSDSGGSSSDGDQAGNTGGSSSDGGSSGGSESSGGNDGGSIDNENDGASEDDGDVAQNDGESAGDSGGGGDSSSESSGGGSSDGSAGGSSGDNGDQANNGSDGNTGGSSDGGTIPGGDGGSSGGDGGSVPGDGGGGSTDGSAGGGSSSNGGDQANNGGGSNPGGSDGGSSGGTNPGGGSDGGSTGGGGTTPGDGGSAGGNPGGNTGENNPGGDTGGNNPGDTAGNGTDPENPGCTKPNPSNPSQCVCKPRKEKVRVRFDRVCSEWRSAMPSFLFFEEAVRPILSFEAILPVKKQDAQHQNLMSVLINGQYYSYKQVYAASTGYYYVRVPSSSIPAAPQTRVMKAINLASLNLFEGTRSLNTQVEVTSLIKDYPKEWRSIPIRVTVCDDKNNNGRCTDEKDGTNALSIQDQTFNAGRFPRSLNIDVWHGRHMTLRHDPDYCEKQYSPIVLDLEGDGIELTGNHEGLSFDINATGKPVYTGWVGGDDDAFLVRDVNGNGTIDDGSELFGSATRLANGMKAPNGFEALRELDSDQDNLLTPDDENWSDLRLWVDWNFSGTSEKDEMFTLDQWNLESINLDYIQMQEVDPYGNETRQRSVYRRIIEAKSIPRLIVDVWFNTLVD